MKFFKSFSKGFSIDRRFLLEFYILLKIFIDKKAYTSLFGRFFVNNYNRFHSVFFRKINSRKNYHEILTLYSYSQPVRHFTVRKFLSANKKQKPHRETPLSVLKIMPYTVFIQFIQRNTAFTRKKALLFPFFCRISH